MNSEQGSSNRPRLFASREAVITRVQNDNFAPKMLLWPLTQFRCSCSRCREGPSIGWFDGVLLCQLHLRTAHWPVCAASCRRRAIVTSQAEQACLRLRRG